MLELVFLMWLHLKSSISPAKARKLIEAFGSAEKVYLADKDTYAKNGVSNPHVVRELLDKSVKNADKEIESAKRKGITLLGFGLDDYPELLYEIEDPPLILYVKGSVSVLHKRNMFCIVGTRRSTAYGMSAAIGVAEQLARCGMIIVSGVAIGIDSAAHRGAVRGGGQTVGIMGCGLDVEYPSQNAELRHTIAENGALISEFPLGTPPLGANFPKRNRLLSAFSLGVAVMEAGERSGALITAKYAAEQGRDVFALPGNISNPMSSGTNQLIQDGAALLTGADAILTEYLVRYPEFFSIHEIVSEDKNDKNIVEEKSAELDENDAEALREPQITPYEKRLYKFLKKEPQHADALSRASGLDIKEVLSIITLLQIKGKIKEHPGNRFSR